MDWRQFAAFYNGLVRDFSDELFLEVTTLYAVIVRVFLYVVLKFMFKVYPAGLAGECAFLHQIRREQSNCN